MKSKSKSMLSNLVGLVDPEVRLAVVNELSGTLRFD